MNPLIINEPGLLTLRHRFTNSFLTLAFWVFWIYLWLPVISLVAWWAGFHLFYEEMIVQKGYQAFFDLAAWYGMVVLSIAIVFLSWAWYNRLRFRGKERRKEAGRVRQADVARQFGVQADQIDRWRGAKRLVIHHSEKGRIDRVEM
jgi:biofilm PGA synthesis protein PgaD